MSEGKYEGKDSMFPIIDEVKETLEQRAKMYGAPEDSFDRIGKMWSAFKGCEFSRNDVVIMMILLKVAREAFQHKRDNFIDIIGYAAHAGNFASDERVQYDEAFKEAVQEETVNMDEPDTEAADHASDSIKFIDDMLKRMCEQTEREQRAQPQIKRYGEPIWVAPRRDYPLPPTYTMSAQDSKAIDGLIDALFTGLLGQHK